jgi:hypothetical protein
MGIDEITSVYDCGKFQFINNDYYLTDNFSKEVLEVMETTRNKFSGKNIQKIEVREFLIKIPEEYDYYNIEFHSGFFENKISLSYFPGERRNFLSFSSKRDKFKELQIIFNFIKVQLDQKKIPYSYNACI